ncbi:MAG: ribonuclease P protein component [Flammeovirgaceae bacterium]|nr:ribonuclease P protein component [Flammeovirgaceae bacterium]
MGKYTFQKTERLSGEKSIRELFKKGISIKVFPIRVIVMKHPSQEYPVHQVLISVAKQSFKKATDRNTVKRRIREGYRLNKSKLATTEKLMIAYLYTAKEILPSSVIHEKLIESINRINENFG